MARPSKPIVVLKNEKKSHRTKAELSRREEAEKALMSGEKLKEWTKVRARPVAHKTFLKINKLFKNIEKNDALFEGVINRYCQLTAECEDFEEKRERFYKNLNDMEDRTPSEERDVGYYKTLSAMQAQIINCDKQVMQKRKMLLDIEKENVMTVASVLRSIPKKEIEHSEEDPMEALLRHRA